MQNNIHTVSSTSDLTSCLRELYHGASAGIITAWSKTSRQTYSFSVDDIDSAARQILALCQSHDVYIGHGLQGSAPPRRSRGNNEGVVFVGGIFLDIDTQEGPHGSAETPHGSKSLPTDTDEALKILRDAGLPEPSLLVQTGGGCHAHWLYKEPKMITTEAERSDESALSRAFQQTVRAVFKRQGYELDSTHDLARLCRAPGTFNHKESPVKPVQLLAVGSRYDRSEIQTWASFRFPPVPSQTAISSYIPAKITLEEVIKDESAHLPKRGGPQPDCLAPIMAGCAWIIHCFENANCLSEPEWHASLGITGRTIRGNYWSHEASKPYPAYSINETDEKIQHAVNDAGPILCDRVAENFRYEGCSQCPFRASIKSPMNLAKEPVERVLVQRSFVFVMMAESYIDLPTGKQMNTSAFANKVRAEIGKNPHDRLMGSNVTPKVMEALYQPGVSNLIITQDPSIKCVNTWKRGGVIPVDGDYLPILAYFEKVIPDEFSRNHLLKYLAHLIQYPGIKVSHGVMMIGAPGTGKSTLLYLLYKLFGETNVRKLEGNELGNRFNSRLVDAQVIFIEESDHGEKFEVYENTKELMTGNYYNTEAKYKEVCAGITPRGIFMTSNHAAPMVIPKDDRRWFVLETQPQPVTAAEKAEHDSFFGNLRTVMDADNHYVSAFAHHLSQLDLSDFKPNALPPMTRAKEQASQESLTPLAQVVSYVIEEDNILRSKDLVAVRDILAAIAASEWNKHANSSPNKLGSALKSIGCRQVPRNEEGKPMELVLPDGSRLRPWAIRNVAYWEKQDRETLKAEVLRAREAGPRPSFQQFGATLRLGQS